MKMLKENGKVQRNVWKKSSMYFIQVGFTKRTAATRSDLSICNHSHQFGMKKSQPLDFTGKYCAFGKCYSTILLDTTHDKNPLINLSFLAFPCKVENSSDFVSCHFCE